ncbi:hypothetical protein ACLOJK_025351 [Asimina triloba]
MDRVRTRSPVYVRQKSISSSSGTSPRMSPMHRHVRSGSSGTFRRTQNNAAKAAAQRLAQVMAHQQADDDDEDEEDDDNMSVDFGMSAGGSIGPAAGRGMKPPSPRAVRPYTPPSPRASTRSPSPAVIGARSCLVCCM